MCASHHSTLCHIGGIVDLCVYICGVESYFTPLVPSQATYAVRIIEREYLFRCTHGPGTISGPYFVQHKNIKLAHPLNNWLDERTSDNCFKGTSLTKPILCVRLYMGLALLHSYIDGGIVAL